METGASEENVVILEADVADSEEDGTISNIREDPMSLLSQPGSSAHLNVPLFESHLFHKEKPQKRKDAPSVISIDPESSTGWEDDVDKLRSCPEQFGSYVGNNSQGSAKIPSESSPAVHFNGQAGQCRSQEEHSYLSSLPGGSTGSCPLLKLRGKDEPGKLVLQATGENGEAFAVYLNEDKNDCQEDAASDFNDEIGLSPMVPSIRIGELQQSKIVPSGEVVPNVSYKDNDTQRYILECPGCKYKFVDQVQYILHLEKDTGKLFNMHCVKCDKMIQSRNMCQIACHLKHHLDQNFKAPLKSSKLEFPMFIYKCLICNVTFSSSVRFERHLIKNKHLRQMSKCLLCDQVVKYLNECEKYQHEATHEKPVGTFNQLVENNLDSVQIEGKAEKYKHVATAMSKGYTEKMALDLYEGTLTLRHHRQFCTECHIPSTNIVAHLHGFRTKAFDYRCHLCGLIIKSHCSFLAHKKLHQGESKEKIKSKPFMCPECGLKFMGTWTLYIKHLVEECLHGIKVFRLSCLLCKKNVYDSVHLSRHMESHIAEFFHCVVCGQGFAQMKILINHHRQKHGNAFSQVETVSLRHCLHCPATLRNKKQEEDHIKKHVKESMSKARFEFVCLECEGTAFENKDALIEHKINKHLKGHYCKSCLKAFLSFERFQQHVSELHQKDEPGGGVTESCDQKEEKTITLITSLSEETEGEVLIPSLKQKQHTLTSQEGQERRLEDAEIGTPCFNSFSPKSPDKPFTTTNNSDSVLAITETQSTITIKPNKKFDENEILIQGFKSLKHKTHTITGRSGQDSSEQRLKIMVSKSPLRAKASSALSESSRKPQQYNAQQKHPFFISVVRKSDKIGKKSNISSYISLSGMQASNASPGTSAFMPAKSKSAMEHDFPVKLKQASETLEPFASSSEVDRETGHRLEYDNCQNCKRKYLKKREIPHKCRYQKDERADDEKSLCRSRATQGKTVCGHCLGQFESKQQLMDHMYSQTLASLPLLACSYCSSVLQNKCALKAHINLHMTTFSSPSACPECGLLFTKQEKYRKHVVDSCFHNNRVACIKCTTCVNNIPLNDYLDHLLKGHCWTGTCLWCRKEGIPKGDIKDHYGGHLEVLTMNLITFRFFCHHCPGTNLYHFSNLDDLLAHLITDHKDVTVLKGNKKGEQAKSMLFQENVALTKVDKLNPSRKRKQCGSECTETVSKRSKTVKDRCNRKQKATNTLPSEVGKVCPVDMEKAPVDFVISSGSDFQEMAEHVPAARVSPTSAIFSSGLHETHADYTDCEKEPDDGVKIICDHLKEETVDNVILSSSRLLVHDTATDVKNYAIEMSSLQEEEPAILSGNRNDKSSDVAGVFSHSLQNKPIHVTDGTSVNLNEEAIDAPGASSLDVPNDVSEISHQEKPAHFPRNTTADLDEDCNNASKISSFEGEEPNHFAKGTSSDLKEDHQSFNNDQIDKDQKIRCAQGNQMHARLAQKILDGTLPKPVIKLKRIYHRFFFNCTLCADKRYLYLKWMMRHYRKFHPEALMNSTEYGLEKDKQLAVNSEHPQLVQTGGSSSCLSSLLADASFCSPAISSNSEISSLVTSNSSSVIKDLRTPNNTSVCSDIPNPTVVTWGTLDSSETSFKTLQQDQSFVGGENDAMMNRKKTVVLPKLVKYSPTNLNKAPSADVQDNLARIKRNNPVSVSPSVLQRAPQNLQIGPNTGIQKQVAHEKRTNPVPLKLPIAPRLNIQEQVANRMRTNTVVVQPSNLQIAPPKLQIAPRTDIHKETLNKKKTNPVLIQPNVLRRAPPKLQVAPRTDNQKRGVNETQTIPFLSQTRTSSFPQMVPQRLQQSSSTHGGEQPSVSESMNRNLKRNETFPPLQKLQKSNTVTQYCQFCGHTSDTRFKFLIHISLEHSGVLPALFCPICEEKHIDVTYSDSCDLQNHLLSNHLQEEREEDEDSYHFLCNLCNLDMPNLVTFIRHICKDCPKSVTKEKCPWCRYKSISDPDLQAHLYAEHKALIERYYRFQGSMSSCQVIFPLGNSRYRIQRSKLLKPAQRSFDINGSQEQKKERSHILIKSDMAGTNEVSREVVRKPSTQTEADMHLTEGVLVSSQKRSVGLPYSDKSKKPNGVIVIESFNPEITDNFELPSFDKSQQLDHHIVQDS